MAPKNIKEFRDGLHTALRAHGFQRRTLGPNLPATWELAGIEVLPRYFPQEIRRAWGFNLTGSVAVELPEFREWLNARYPAAQQGIFRDCFVSWFLANDRDFDFLTVEGEEVPFDDWVDRVKSRLQGLPQTLDGLVAAYQRHDPTIRGLSSGINAKAWDFLVEWSSRRDTQQPIPAA